MPSTLDETNNRGVFALFKGESGSGKSTAALSFPGVYVLDFDKKMPTIAQKHFKGKDIHYDTFTEINPMIRKLESFKDECPYETIVADSLTSLCDLSIRTIGKLKGENAKDMFADRKVSRSKSGEMSLEMLSIDYYNGEFRLIRDYFIDALRVLWCQPGNPKNVILIAHVLEVESAPDLKTKLVTTSRSIVTAGRKVAAFVPTQYDEEYFFQTEKPDFGTDDKELKRVCFTQSVGEDSAKTAYPLPARIDFTKRSFYEQIQKYITGIDSLS